MKGIASNIIDFNILSYRNQVSKRLGLCEFGVWVYVCVRVCLSVCLLLVLFYCVLLKSRFNLPSVTIKVWLRGNAFPVHPVTGDVMKHTSRTLITWIHHHLSNLPSHAACIPIKWHVFAGSLWFLECSTENLASRVKVNFSAFFKLMVFSLI